VSSLALMRFLESAPDRYDWGMRVITFGGSTRVHDSIAEIAVRENAAKVVEVGCGTGAVTERLVRGGADVTAIDQNPEMLALAKKRLAGATKEVDWRETTASEIDSLPAGAYNAVVMSFSLSEMQPEERSFVLRESARRLRTGGVLIVGDETLPKTGWKRLLVQVLRVPQVALAWMLTGSWSTPIARLADEVAAAGLVVESEQRWRLETMAVVVGHKGGEVS